MLVKSLVSGDAEVEKRSVGPPETDLVPRILCFLLRGNRYYNHSTPTLWFRFDLKVFSVHHKTYTNIPHGFLGREKFSCGAGKID